MVCLLISYDLDKPDRNYDGLGDEIKKLNSTADYARVLESVWLVQTELSVNEVLLRLQGVTDPGDGLLVVKVSAPFAAQKLRGTTIGRIQEWLG